MQRTDNWRAIGGLLRHVTVSGDDRAVLIVYHANDNAVANIKVSNLLRVCIDSSWLIDTRTT